MTIKGPEGDNSFVFHRLDAERGMRQSKSEFRTYLGELCKALALLLALAGLVGLPLYTLYKHGWAVFIFFK